MANKANLFNRYIWLADLIYSSGKITRQEIDNRWSKCSLNEDGSNYIPERTFHRWRQEIEELFQLVIECGHGPQSEYYIKNAEEIATNTTQKWLLNTFAVANAVNSCSHIKDCILLEDMPSDARFLTPILDAIQSKKVLKVTYKKFSDAAPHTFTMEPYCVKTFKLRWYMVGKSSDHPDEIRVYSLDRIQEMSVTDTPYSIPEDFDAKEYFKDYYGVWTGPETAEHIVVQLTAAAANYVRSLPLHHTQKEIEQTNEYSVFEFNVAPTYDFIQELRTHGSNLKVIKPKSLAMKFRELGWEYTLMYPKEGDSK